MHSQNSKINPKVLLISTSYPRDDRDWRGRFIADMVQALCDSHELHILLWAPPGLRPKTVDDAALPAESAWLNQLAEQGGIAHALRANAARGLTAAIGLLLRLRHAYRRNSNVDLVHVNWLQNALPLWGSKTPALITVLGSDFGLLRIPGMKLVLRSVLKQRKSILAPNAEWMVPKLREDFGDIAQIVAIPFGVEKTWFTLERRELAPSTPQWLAITRLTRNKIGNLLEWGNGLFGTHRHLHLFGPMQEEITLPHWITYHGPTNPSDLQNKWFPLASGLITLSQHDEGRPQVMLEAMAAGLPVIASDLPGHRDLIKHGETGWLATSPENLKEALCFLEDNHNNFQMGMCAKNWITKHIGTWDNCAERYRRSYYSLLEREVEEE
jgi:glycosyltransferase involved in cell wall biosynthesis